DEAGFLFSSYHGCMVALERAGPAQEGHVMRRAWLLLPLVLTFAIVVPAALSTTQSAPRFPALKLKGNAARGSRVFVSANCSGCHYLKRASVPPFGPGGGPNLDTLKPSFALVVKTVYLGKGPANDPEAGMPAFSRVKGASKFRTTILTAQQIA